MPQVEFYILTGTASAARLKFACGLIEQAYLAGSRVLVRATDAQELDALDTLLWTFSERAFVPHDRVGESAVAPVQLATGPLPALTGYDALLELALDGNLATAPPPRIVEIVDADETRRRQGRERFRAYRERGWAPVTHNIDNGTDAANG